MSETREPAEPPIEEHPQVDQTLGAIAERMQAMGNVGNFADSGLLWQCHRLIQGLRVELRKLRLGLPSEIT